MIKKLSVLFVLVFSSFSVVFPQTIQSRQYQQNYFRYPLDLPPSTAGSFGELRPNHFHSGLDFKTNHRTGYPVHAVFDGYVSRLRVQLGGFGNAIYINHPNGYTSVYGHIEKFSDAMEKVVREAQAQQQSFEVDVILLPQQIPVCKDDIIALSGNAGASEGPHLHFELRDSKTEETVNPQLFGLTIPDKIAPSITGIAIYQMDGNPFSEKTPSRFLAAKGKLGNFHLVNPEVIHLSGAIGFGVRANDMNSVSENHNGVYSMELKLDGKTVYTFAVERFGFDQTRAINAHIDYPHFLKTHLWVQKCFILPGNKISLYPQSINRGIINFNDNALHTVEYIAKDIMGNTASLTIKVKAGPGTVNAPLKPKGVMFHYDKQNEFSNNKVKVVVPTGNLYDDVDFIYATLPKRPGAFSQTHCIHNFFTPIHDGFELWIKPDSTIGKYTDKAVLVNSAGICDGGIYDNGYVKATVHSFGNYFVLIDTVPPVILPLNIKSGINLSAAKGIFLKIKDNLSGVKNYIGKIDGKWVLMEWDFKTRVLSYTFNADITPGVHKFELRVTDNKDNTSNFEANFTR
jgi:hypothetical protein